MRTPKVKKLAPIKERKPIPPRGSRHTDRKKEASRKACRKGQW